MQGILLHSVTDLMRLGVRESDGAVPLCAMGKHRRCPLTGRQAAAAVNTCAPVVAAPRVAGGPCLQVYCTWPAAVLVTFRAGYGLCRKYGSGTASTTFGLPAGGPHSLSCAARHCREAQLNLAVTRAPSQRDKNGCSERSPVALRPLVLSLTHEFCGNAGSCSAGTSRQLNETVVLVGSETPPLARCCLAAVISPLSHSDLNSCYALPWTLLR